METMTNFLIFLGNNWVLIIFILCVIFGLYLAIKKFIKLSNDKKLEIIYQKISETILKNVSDAESFYYDIKQSGSIKRAQVIKQIYEDYPLINKIADQKSIIKKIDELIDKALEELNEIINKNKK